MPSLRHASLVNRQPDEAVPRPSQGCGAPSVDGRLAITPTISFLAIAARALIVEASTPLDPDGRQRADSDFGGLAASSRGGCVIVGAMRRSGILFV